MAEEKDRETGNGRVLVFALAAWVIILGLAALQFPL